MADEKVSTVRVCRRILQARSGSVYLDEVVNGLQVSQVIVGHIHTNAEVEAGVPPVNDFEVSELQKKWNGVGVSRAQAIQYYIDIRMQWHNHINILWCVWCVVIQNPPDNADQALYLYKVGVFGITDCHYSVNLFNKLLFLIIIKLHVPLGQSGLSCPILNEDKADLQRVGGRES